MDGDELHKFEKSVRERGERERERRGVGVIAKINLIQQTADVSEGRSATPR